MDYKEKIEEYGNRIAELERRIGSSVRLKGRILDEVARLNSEYNAGKITQEQKQAYFIRIFDSQSYDDWLNYYENDIRKSREIISSLRSEIRSIEDKADKESSASEARKKYMAIFMALALVFGLLAFAGMPEGGLQGITKGILEPKSGIIGNVVLTGATTGSILDYSPNQDIGSLITFTLTIQSTGDNVGNETWINVTLLDNSSMTALENFILNSSGWNCYNNSYGTLRDVDNVRGWEGITGYGFGRNATAGKPKCTPTNNYLVNLTPFFTGGLYAPSVLGTYNVTFNATYNRTVAGIARVNPEIVVWQNIEFNVTERWKPTMNVSAPLNNTFNNSQTIVFEYTPWDNYSLKNCSILFDNAVNSTNYTVSNFTKSTFSFSSMADAIYRWRINCTDSSPSYNVNGTEEYVVYMDMTAPTMTIIRPSSSNNLTTINYMNFSWNATDKMSPGTFCNITINGTVNNTAPLYNTNGTTFNFSKVSIPIGKYVWNVTCWDNASNMNSTPTWDFSVTELDAPKIDLSAPLHNTYNSSEEIVFSYTPKENLGLLNCSIIFNNIWNSTNSTIANDTLATFNFSSMADGIYDWSINCTDSSPSYNTNESEVRRLFVDRTGPTITPIVPSNSTATENAFMNFTWNATDIVWFDMFCNLTINGTVRNPLPLNGTNMSMMNYTVSGLEIGSYLWNITCWDNASNTNTTPLMLFNITPPSNTAPPDTIIVGIMDDDTDDCGNNAYDKTTNTTHMDYVFGPTLNWTEGVDPEANGIKTRVCIGTTTDVYLIDLHAEAAGNASTICTVLNAWYNASAIDNQWVNLTNSTFTYGGTNKTFYASFMP
ncbi:hypothetical protein COV19_04170, partial [Candidatus Woesearchaeota archaeon CG10_big_fil_rev_8_21_14_0_10_44_13]